MSDFFDFDPEVDEVINREVIVDHIPLTDRSVSRRIALQSLYEIDSVNHPVGEVLDHNLMRSPDHQRTIRKYIEQLVLGVVANRTKIDTVLQKYASDWPIDQVAVIDRNILRIALFELGVETRTPVAVAIDEAMELAVLFGAENTPRFVNGVLGAISDNLDDIRSYLGATPSEPQSDESDADTSIADTSE
ncbi:MAG: transcription antitermination factor NusB [Anaerolineae bacterium]